MNEMKKILALLVCLLTISTGVCADDDRPVRFDQLPAKAQAYVCLLYTSDAADE